MPNTGKDRVAPFRPAPKAGNPQAVLQRGIAAEFQATLVERGGYRQVFLGMA